VRDSVGGNATHFQYGHDGALLYAHNSQNGDRFLHIRLAGSLVATRKVASGGAADVTYQHTDALGSPVATTNAAGALVERERMTAYGEPADGTWSDRPGFTGHQMDAGSRLVYMQQRHYDPEIAIFLGTDPIAADILTGENTNRFRYAANNPFRFVDPDGRQETVTTASEKEDEAKQRERVGTSMADHPGIQPSVSGATTAPRSDPTESSGDALPERINGVRAIYSCRETNSCVQDPRQVKRGGEYMLGFFAITAGGGVALATVETWGPPVAAAMRTPEGRAAVLLCLRAVASCFGERAEVRYMNLQVRQTQQLLREGRQPVGRGQPTRTHVERDP
jgi:RHS repeat-associated protein